MTHLGACYLDCLLRFTGQYITSVESTLRMIDLEGSLNPNRAFKKLPNRA